MSIRVNNDHSQDFIDSFQIESDQVDDNASNSSSQLVSDDSSHDDGDLSWVPEEDDCSKIIVDDEESYNHDNVGNNSMNHSIMLGTTFLHEQHQTSV